MASYVNSSRRRCAFRQTRPRRFPIFDIGCQFTGDVDNQLPDYSAQLIDYNGELRCPFHLPKAYWASEERRYDMSARQVSNAIVDLARSFDSDRWDFPLDLTGVVFPEEIRFEGIDLPSILFQSCEFLDHVTFKKCKFQFHAHFDYSRFHKDVAIFDCEFSNELVFRETHFFDLLRMTGSQCHEIRAHSSRFSDRASFSNFSINDKIDLSYSEFSKEVLFFNIDAVKEISLISSHMRRGLSIEIDHPVRLDLSRATIQGPVNASGQTFGGFSLHNATFSDAISEPPSESLKEDRWTGEPDWAHSPRLSIDRSRASLNFCRTTFEGEADFSAAHSVGDKTEAMLPEITFKDAVFSAGVSFNNRIFGASTSFTGAAFSHAPRFHNCTLHQDTSFYRTRFLDYQRIRRLQPAERAAEAEIATRSFRSLKLASESTRARREQTKFFAEEERRNRLDPDTPTLVTLTSRFYEISSDYGRSLLRPAAWWLSAQMIFFAIYKELLTEGIPKHQDLKVIARLTLQQIFRPFELFNIRSANSDQLATTYLRDLSMGTVDIPIFALAVISIFHSVLTLSLLALFLLALRRQFKLD